MEPGRRTQVSALYNAALERPAEERGAFLIEACAGDEALRNEVESLLRFESASLRFLECPAGAGIGVVEGDAILAGPLLPGTILGPYRIDALIGAGGMGQVYRARDVRLGRLVAIKVLPDILRSDPERQRRFEREARALSSLTHPHICTLHDIGDDNALTYLVMELVEGDTLATRLESGPLSVNTALQYATEIASALEWAHSQGVIHRDLKPGNVMVTRNGAKLLDFGLAKLRIDPTTDRVGATGGITTTVQGAILGTLQYMAPEQLESAEVDARIDIFAFGAVVYEMLTGRKAFQGDSQASLISAVLRDEPLPMGAEQSVVPVSLDRFVRKCLAKDPEERWQSAADLTRELRQIVDERRAPLTDIPKDDSVNSRLWAFTRNPIIAAAFLVLMISGAWFAFRGWPDHQAASTVDLTRRVAVLPFSYKGAETYAYLGEGIVDLLSGTLDGAGHLKTIDPRAVLGLMTQQRRGSNGESRVLEAGVDVARRVSDGLGAHAFVVGEIVEAGGRLRIAARLYQNRDGEQPSICAVEGRPDELFQLVDGLSAQLATGGGAEPGAQLAKAAARTTSLEALKTFLQGEQSFRGGGDEGRAAAYSAYQRTVDQDPSFSIAWYRLSQLAYFSGAALDRVPEYAERAVQFSHSLPWRQRRLIEAYDAYARGAVRDSERAYREILQTYADDVEALSGLSTLVVEYRWLLGGSPDRDRQLLEAFLHYQPNDFMGLWRLRNAEARRGNCSGAHLLNRRMSPSKIPLMHHAVAVFCGPPSKEQEELLKTAQQGIESMGVGRLWLNMVARNPRAAAEFARLDERNGNPETLALKHLFLAEMELAQGRAEAAREQFSRLATVNSHWAVADLAYRELASHHQLDSNRLRELRDSVQRWDTGSIPPAVSAQGLRLARHDGVHAHIRVYLLGRIAARLHEFESALRYASDLGRMERPKDAGSLSQDLAQSIRAHVLAEQGKLEEALRALEAAPREVPFTRRNFSWAFVQPQERLLRAELLSRLGRPQEALEWYQSVEYWPESVLAGPSHLRQAEIHEGLGHREEAIDQYRRFVDLWRDCDPQFRMLVEDAQGALQSLTRS